MNKKGRRLRNNPLKTLIIHRNMSDHNFELKNEDFNETRK